jgi:hypothetical protein
MNCIPIPPHNPAPDHLNNLEQLNDRNKQGKSITGDILGGFCGISRRTGKKPIIAAVNGYAFGTSHPPPSSLLPVQFDVGGGFEMVINWYVSLVG